MNKTLLFVILVFTFSCQARLKNCNTCKSCSSANQTCCFLVDRPEDCNSYTCNPACPNVTNPKCVYDPVSCKYKCICS